MRHDLQTRQHALTLLREGRSYEEVARICRVPRGTVGYWLHMDRVQRGEPLPDIEKQTSCARCGDLPLARVPYAYLLGLYLGDGHIVRPRQHRTWTLSIFCSDDWPGLKDAATAAMTAVVPTCRPCRVQRTGCTEIKAYSKHWLCLFPQHGPGRKHERAIRLEPWQRDVVAEQTRHFLRGLFHSDGTRILNRVRHRLPSGDRWYEYPRYQFDNRSPDILELCGWALDHLGIEWRYSNPTTISVSKREAVAAMDEFIGPKY
ncbi:hypothetical protein TH66_07440 [Carbonactinospora thermoautotrophica]|uniref:DOD-type homing endonuclease domain-containing protein n=1 Tax=Carbonactinospora thermoautotrophica TaxID=1469144 RepID=A0A132NB97_9ACTN|nr:helix-turn-helix domain-containing protein [Carbonactinospora thermoautotrophica]KWX04416.1 hypothetical protein TH66_07440 [Carbonactinospora thermoautotrophica]KWX07364.1 hypothetical protein TR74_18985 [Carbonactinospora thermoautotrophica]